MREPICLQPRIHSVSTDNEIIARSLTDPSQFGELFNRHAVRIHRYAARRAGDTAAEDILSTTFLRAFEKRSRFNMSFESALPWLLGIATNLLKQHRVAELRTLRMTEGLLVTTTIPDHSDASNRVVDAQSQVSRLANEIAALRKGDRDVLLLFAWEDLTYEEIGVALSIPTGTVRSRLNRARRILRAVPTTLEVRGEQLGIA